METNYRRFPRLAIVDRSLNSLHYGTNYRSSTAVLFARLQKSGRTSSTNNSVRKFMSQPDDAEIHPAALPFDQLLAQCHTQRTRRGGPGGQHRNKTETAIVLLHERTGVSGQAGERRSQKQNREVALARLRLNLALAVRSKKCLTDQKPSEIWRSRVSGKRISVSTNHFDFAAMLAEALDWIETHQYRLSNAAETLQLSTSQLIKLLKQHPDAWQMVQTRRHDLGLPRLK